MYQILGGGHIIAAEKAHRFATQPYLLLYSRKFSRLAYILATNIIPCGTINAGGWSFTFLLLRPTMREHLHHRIVKERVQGKLPIFHDRIIVLLLQSNELQNFLRR